MSITHAFVNPKADSADTTIVRPLDWNAAHVGNGLDVLNIEDYGAVADSGTTDNTVAIAAALTAAASTGRPVLIPAVAGHFKITSDLTIPDGVEVFGYGWGSTIKQYTREKNVFVMGSFCTVRNLHLIGDNGTTHSTGDLLKNNGVFAQGEEQVRVVDNFIEQFECPGVHVRDCSDVTISRNVIFGAPMSSTVQGDQADIIVTSDTAGKRLLISENSCLSNTSEGIYVNRLGGDADLIITKNRCVTLDPSTCTEGGTWAEMASPLNRRHGISCGYTNNGQSRVIVEGNICRNTKWSGIYMAGGGVNAGPLLVTDNFCSRNALDTTDSSLSGGIVVYDWGQEVVSGNIILDYQDPSSAAIHIIASVLPTEPAFVTGNYIINSLGEGIHIDGYSSLVNIANNTIYGSVKHDIKIAQVAAQAGVGGHVIKNNHIQRTTGTAYSAINISMQAGTNPIVIRDNHLIGFDNTTSTAENAGIYYAPAAYVQTYRNHIEKFYYGIYSALSFASGTRFFDYILAENILENCALGIVTDCAASTSVVPLVDNVFIACSTNHDNINTGNEPGYVCRREGTKLVVFELTAAPSVGTWLAGDRARFNAPAAGGVPGSWCTTGGNPGTWKGEAALSA